MKTINPLKTTIPELHHTILGAVAPRPIAFASTIDKDGNPNLSPFSFFNAFGVNPATLIFSPSRRGRDNSTKHTYENLKEVPEVVINTVNYNLVQQASLSSTEYPKGVNEFTKSGLTAIPSEKIKPYRVKESPVQFECRVRDIIETGDKGGAGILIICDILLIHIDESVINEKGDIDPHELDLVGRLGRDYYCRTSGDAVFTVEKPLQRMGIGIDQLPDKIKYSKYLSGNELGQLGNIESLPTTEEIKNIKNSEAVQKIFSTFGNTPELEEQIIIYAKSLINNSKVKEALNLLMGF